jgi:hypothetical protein
VRTIIAGWLSSRTESGEPTSITVLPTENPDGAVPLDEPLVGGVIVPVQELDAKTIVLSGIETLASGRPALVIVRDVPLTPESNSTPFATWMLTPPTLCGSSRFTVPEPVVTLFNAIDEPPITMFPPDTVEMELETFRIELSFRMRELVPLGITAWPVVEGVTMKLPATAVTVFPLVIALLTVTDAGADTTRPPSESTTTTKYEKIPVAPEFAVYVGVSAVGIMLLIVPLYHWYDRVPVPVADAVSVIVWPTSAAVVPDTLTDGAGETTTCESGDWTAPPVNNPPTTT